jgi:hypothetical protein
MTRGQLHSLRERQREYSDSPHGAIVARSARRIAPWGFTQYSLSERENGTKECRRVAALPSYNKSCAMRVTRRSKPWGAVAIPQKLQYFQNYNDIIN